MTKSNKDLISNITSIITLLLMAMCGVLLMIAIGHILSELVVLNEQQILKQVFVVKNGFNESWFINFVIGIVVGSAIYELLPERYK